MVYRWACPHCGFVVWAVKRPAAEFELKSHLVHHYGDVFSQTVFRTEWACPECDHSQSNLDHSDAVESFEDHLLSHTREQIVETGAMGTDFGPDTGVLCLIPDDRRGLKMARSQLLYSGDVVVSVTNDLAAWNTLIEQQSRTPKKVVLLTSARESEIESIDDSELLTIKSMGGDLNVGQVGRKLAETMKAYSGIDGQVTAEFDMLSSVLEACDTGATFRFLHLIDGVFSKTDARSLVSINPAWVPEPTLNVFTDLFDFIVFGDDDRLKRLVKASGPSVHHEDSDRTYSEITPSNQQIVPTGPKRNPFR